MANTTEFILEVQSTGEEKVEDLRQEVDKLNKAANQSAAASNKMAGGLDKVDKKTRLAEKGVNRLKDGYNKLSSVQGIVMALAGAALVGYAAKLADAASTLNGLSDEIGINSEKLQVYADVATLAGGSIEGVASSIRSMNIAINEGVKGNETIGQIFKDLNIDIKAFQDLKPEEKIQKLSKAIQGYSIAEQDYIIKTLKAEGLQKILKAPDEVEARASYLEQNGLILRKGEIERLNEFTDKWQNLMTDITNFSTIVLSRVGETLNDIFNMEPSDENSLLNRKTAEAIGNFISRLIIVFKMLYETVSVAQSGLGALADKGVYVIKTIEVYLGLFVQYMKKLGSDIAIIFNDFSLNDVVKKMKANFDLFISNVNAKIAGIQIALGKLFRSQSITNAGLERMEESVKNAATAQQALDDLKLKSAETDKKLNDNEVNYLKEKENLRQELQIIKSVNDRKSVENNNKIRESTDAIGKSYQQLIAVGQKKIEQNDTEEKQATKKLTNLNEQKKAIDELNKLEVLRIQLLKLQGEDLQANEKSRQLAIEQVKKDFTDVEQQTEAIDITNKMFDYSKWEIQLKKVNEDLDKLNARAENMSPFNDNWKSTQDAIAEKTKEQIDLQNKLKISIEETNEADLLSKKDLEAANRSLVESSSSLFVDYMKGAKSATDAIGDFFGNLATKILELIAQQIILNTVTAAFGGNKSDAASGKTGLFTSLAGAAASSYGGGWAGLASNMAGSIFHNGGEIQQGDLMRPEGFNFKSDEGFIVARAQETISTKQQVADGALGGGSGDTINNNIMIDGDSLTDKIFKTQSMDRNLNNYFKKNGPLLKNYFS